MQQGSYATAPAHRGRARGDARARGARAHARRAALGGGGRYALQRHATLSNPQQVAGRLWLARSIPVAFPLL